MTSKGLDDAVLSHASKENPSLIDVMVSHSKKVLASS